MKSTTKALILALCLGAMSGVTWAQTDHSFVTHQSGAWGNGLTWEEFIPNFGTIYPATQIPSSANGAIRIGANHTVTISSGNVTVDQLTINGTLRVNPGTTLTIADGAGVDLFMGNGSLFIDGTLVNNGTIEIDTGLLKLGTLVNNGSLTIGGIFQFDQGTITGNDIRYGPTGSAVINFPGYTVDQDNRLWPSVNGPANVTVSGNVTLNGTRTVSGSLTVIGTLQVAGALTTNGATQVSGTLLAGGTVTNNGTTKVFGTLEVTGSFTNNGATEIFGTCKINPGGVVQGNALVYMGCCNKLLFNTSYSVGSGNLFWPSANSPANVIVPAAFSVTLNAARTIAVGGSLEVLGTFEVADTLTSNGTTRVDGTLRAVVKFVNYGTMTIYGTFQADGTFINNATTIGYGMLHVAGTFINIGTTQVYRTLQIVGTLTNAGMAQIFDLCRVAGTLNNDGTLQIDGIFQLDQGGVANGNDFIYAEYGKLVFNNTSGSYVVNGDVVFWPEIDRPTRVLVQGAGGITMKIARILREFETAAVVTNADSLTVSGSVAILAGGVFDSSPVYNGDATLVYGSDNAYNVSTEWRSGISVGSGVPKNVIISEGATVNMPASARTCPGNISIRGKLVLNKTPGANLSVGGNWDSYFGQLIPNSRVVTFNGTAEQTIRAVTTFDSLVVNNPAGILLPGNDNEVIEPDSVTVTKALIFTAGNIRLDLGYLILAGSVSGYSNTRHVVTYGEGRVMRSIAGGGSFLFPVAPTETSYNPITITLAPADTAETFSVRVDSTVNFGSPGDSLFVQRTWDIEEAASGDNHAALTFQWAGVEEGAKFIRTASFTYLNNVELVKNSVAAGTNPYSVSTTGGFPCTEFSLYTVGTPENITAVEGRESEIPAAFTLRQNYPNPFNPATWITFGIPVQAGGTEVRLDIFALDGKLVRTLVQGKYAAGTHRAQWDGRDENGAPSPTGVYFYRIRAGNFAASRKLTLVK